MFVAVVDLRPDAGAFLWKAETTLDGGSHTALYVPPGLALGYQTLADDTVVGYKMPECYEPQFERGARWNDPAFGIDWPPAERTIHPRDLAYPDFDLAAHRSEWDRGPTG
jgi:dTDP-4-dehydrorhamnose 3,5-epimerase